MFKSHVRSLRKALQREEVRSISRRYFISNGFDGTLTAIGITVGSYLSGVPDGMTVVKVGAGAAVGLSTSGLWSVWEIERAEKLADLRDKEEAMLEDLKESRVWEKKEEGRRVNAVLSGLGPLLAMSLIIFPFALEELYISMLQATVASVAVGIGVLFAFGSYMGEISKQKWWKAGLRMGLAGLVVALINILLPG
ncbi:MAG: VIT1/CCC1 transporter family protein [Candidatus Nanohaloarchaea archaeon]|nr:VIT1/CCC1 transporter family protein [Candidatus Nanohaloarchaea archaeon]